MAHDVFISYSTKDKAIADAVCATLESQKIRCWIAPRDVPPGQPYAASLVNAISESSVVVLVLSEGSNSSNHVLRELSEAVDHGIPIMPFRIHDIQPSTEMRFYIKSIHWLDAMTPPLEKHLDKLTSSVQALLSAGEEPKHNLQPMKVAPISSVTTQKRSAIPVWLVIILAFIGLIIIGGMLIIGGFGLWELSQNPDRYELVKVVETELDPSVTATSQANTIQTTLPAPTENNGSPVLTDQFTWVRKAQNTNFSRWSHAGAFDAHRGVFVIFGGTLDERKFYADTLEFDGQNLKLVETSQSPPARYKHRIVYDSNRNVIVLFGGTSQDYARGNYLYDTWEYDGANWKEIETAHSPTPRGGFGMAYDSCRNKVVLFGGYSDVPYDSDTWEYDGNDWTEVQSINVPPPVRSETAMAFDSSRCRSVLFGGEPYNLASLSDTWEFDGNEWVQSNLSRSPMGRWDQAMAFDPIEGKIILYGGYGPRFPGGDLLNDTWVYDGQSWAELLTENSPGFLEQLSMDFDAARKRIVLFGHYGDIWYLEKVDQ
jgi:hypothetical protein